MNKILSQLRSRPALAATGLLILGFAAPTGRSQTTFTWTGGGGDAKWGTALNWTNTSGSSAAPSAGVILNFTGTASPATTNNITAATLFGGILFSSPAAGFSLFGNSITLGGDIVDNQVVVNESVNMPIVLGGNHNLNVTAGGFLTLSGVVSGPGLGLLLPGAGQVTLSGHNTFTGPVSVTGGTLAITNDFNLGAAPGAATPGDVVLNGGKLLTTNNITLNANRGIAVGATGTNSGVGIIQSLAATTLTYGGVIANNGTGASGLEKLGFGGLTLSGTNTYSGPTMVENGLLTLDFSVATAPRANIINPNSSLQLGGANSGFGATNYAQLTMNPKGATNNSQEFAGTHSTFGGSIIRVNGTANSTNTLSLGLLSHDPGGTLVVIPPALTGAKGVVTTTATNVNGILGGFASVGDGTATLGLNIGTNYACVDANGNITNYNGYTVFISGSKLNGVVTPATNLKIDATSTGDVIVDTDSVGSTTDINSIFVNPLRAMSIKIGTNNTLRLGSYGGIFRADTASGTTWAIGESSAGANGIQNIGTLTAGGAPNTPGEIVIMPNSTSETSGSLNIEAKVTDNGTGPVTLVKMGGSSIKLRGHNTFSGGLYLLQGRVQWAGSEIGTANPDGGGTGPVYILPGCYLFPSGAAGNITNTIFIAGNGTSAEPLGAVRLSNGNNLTGPINLIGDTTFGGGTTNFISGQISGPFNVAFCSPVTVNGQVGISNPNNNWTGNTTIQSSTKASTSNILKQNASEVIPDGFGYGNVTMACSTAGNFAFWDMFGFQETINGLSTSGTVPGNCVITNSAASLSTLIVGNNNQSATFAGVIEAGINLVKIGGGSEVLTGTNTFTGSTIVSNGTLAVSGTGAITASSSITVNAGATLDVSGATSFVYPNAVVLNGGQLNASVTAGSLGSLNISNGTVQVAANATAPGATVGSLSTSGTESTVNITSVLNITKYPAQFTLMKYSGSIGGSGFNFTLGTVPAPAITVGYISNNVANHSVDLYLFNGPSPVTWSGAQDLTSWDENVTTNWLAFGATASTYNDGDSVLLTDTATAGATNLNLVNAPMKPASVTVSNSVLNYTFTGLGELAGPMSLLKAGTARLTLANGETNAITFDGIGNSFSSGVTVSGGTLVFVSDNTIAGGLSIAAGSTVQVGTNGGTGNLPAGGIDDEGSLIFSRGGNESVVANISGAGGVVMNDASNSVLYLGGANTFTGTTLIQQGIVQAGTASALGATGVTVTSGGTLDINGINMGTLPVTISGAGAGGMGAVISSNPAQQLNGLLNVTMAGDASIGGNAGRWDIRSTATAQASLSTGGNAYNLSKVGTNYTALVGVTVDTGLGNINVIGGLLSIETTTTSLGNPANTLTVSPGATLQFYGNNNYGGAWNKLFVFNGDGVTTTVNNSNGTNYVGGTITLNNSCLVNATAATGIVFSSGMGGTGSLTASGPGTVAFTYAGNTYSGPTTVAAGQLILNNTVNNGGGLLTIAAGADLISQGASSNTGPVSVSGTLDVSGTMNVGPISFATGSTLAIELGAFGASDLLTSSGTLTLNGTVNIQLNPPAGLGALTSGQNITIAAYTSLVGGLANLNLLPSAPGYTFALVDPATTPGTLQVNVLHVPQNQVWVGNSPAGPGLWDVKTTPNWSDNGTADTFGQGDYANFDDTGLATTVTLVTNVLPVGVNMNSSALTYKFVGAGGIGGSGAFSLVNYGKVILDNTGTNTYGGGTIINAGILQVGNGDAGGSLGTNGITNNSALVFNRSDSALVVSNIMNGSGNITNNGTGVVTLSGNNTNTGFQGSIYINHGTVVVGNNGALGYGQTTISSGATLDLGGPGIAVNAENLGQYPILAVGAGVGGNGAIVNNGPNGQQEALENITLTGDTVFGGTTRWDLRAAGANGTIAAPTAQLNTGSQPFNLTKVGPNFIGIVSVTVDPELNNINIMGGMLDIEGNTSGSVGNPLGTVTVYSNAFLYFYQLASPFNKQTVLLDGGNIESDSGTNIFLGPITLSQNGQGGPGNCTITNQGGVMTNQGYIMGSGNLLKTGSAALYLAGTNLYTGGTYINGGLLGLVGDTSLTNSPVIAVDTGTLDLNLATTNLLTLAPGQMLQSAASGTINGGVLEPAGTYVSPGGNGAIGALTVTNAVTLAGTTIMELNKSVGSTNSDLLTGTAGIVYGGTLAVTNLGTVALTGGETFKLFNSPAGYSGSFSALVPAAPGPNLIWNQTNLTVNGTLSVLSVAPPPPPPPPVITGHSFSGGNLVISGTNGVPNGSYNVVTSTNIATPLANWTFLVSGSFDSSGNFSITNSVSPGVPQQYFAIQIPTP